ncbi:hypothetical protein CHS0354_010089 [Potamilus streckersoni]|uniref:Uncharacterized protein n=1 Tax=Potamilus streckersoni TaxID=2493646 RepID=A0AAE0RRF4_9BIVA|nr:hypothetical protein CHS0354_010089 [Potamilus streckersoni]
MLEGSCSSEEEGLNCEGLDEDVATYDDVFIDDEGDVVNNHDDQLTSAPVERRLKCPPRITTNTLCELQRCCSYGLGRAVNLDNLGYNR